MTIDDVAKIALALLGVTEDQRFGCRTWLVAGKSFRWVPPLSKADVRRFGNQPGPKGTLQAVRVSDLEEKEVLMMDPPAGIFDIQHVNGYPAVLVELEARQRATTTSCSDRGLVLMRASRFGCGWAAAR